MLFINFAENKMYAIIAIIQETLLGLIFDCETEIRIFYYKIVVIKKE